jgi:hypothetical protein
MTDDEVSIYMRSLRQVRWSKMSVEQKQKHSQLMLNARWKSKKPKVTKALKTVV